MDQNTLTQHTDARRPQIPRVDLKTPPPPKKSKSKEKAPTRCGEAVVLATRHSVSMGPGGSHWACERTGDRGIGDGPAPPTRYAGGRGDALGIVSQKRLRKTGYSASHPPQKHSTAKDRPRACVTASTAGAEGTGKQKATYTVSRPGLPRASAGSGMIGWGRVLLSHTLDAARSY